MRKRFNEKSMGEERIWLELHVQLIILEWLRGEKVPVQVQELS
jgi:hypothetical protein